MERVKTAQNKKKSQFTEALNKISDKPNSSLLSHPLPTWELYLQLTTHTMLPVLPADPNTTCYLCLQLLWLLLLLGVSVQLSPYLYYLCLQLTPSLLPVPPADPILLLTVPPTDPIPVTCTSSWPHPSVTRLQLTRSLCYLCLQLILPLLPVPPAEPPFSLNYASC